MLGWNCGCMAATTDGNGRPIWLWPQSGRTLGGLLCTPTTCPLHFRNSTPRFTVNLNSNEHGLVQFWLDPFPPVFYDFASCSQDGAADGLCMGRRARGSDPS